jgi:hypothetical protein
MNPAENRFSSCSRCVPAHPYYGVQDSENDNNPDPVGSKSAHCHCFHILFAD